MAWWLPHNFANKKPYLKQRSRVLGALRAWFAQEGFDEVQTPVLQVSPVMDAHIHAFKTVLKGPDLQPLGDMYLHTSPEFAMKKLLVAGCEKIYQLAPVFRNGDDTRLHSPEFTLLEWYRTGTDYTAMMADCESMLRFVARALDLTHYRFEGKACDPFAPWQRISVREAFSQYAGIDLDACLEDSAKLRAALMRIGVRCADDDGWDDLFFRVMAAKIEPFLGHNVPAILYDYPASMASLSRKKPDDPRYAERFELYVCGVELANAFSELTDAAEQAARFKEEMDVKERLYGERYPIDQGFIAALEHGLPESSGNALGFDRLVMLASNAAHIHQVLWSPVECG